MWLLALLLQYPIIGTPVLVENQTYGRVENALVSPTGTVQYIIIGAGDQVTALPYSFVVQQQGQFVAPTNLVTLRKVTWPRATFNPNFVRARVNPVFQVVPIP